jgi:hypothetical protein
MAMKSNLVNRLGPLAAITRLTLIEAWRGRSARLLLLFLAAVSRRPWQ